ncbi:hypothetical protein BDV98DRAFT_572335 [Pterulicium gracile]|uniref:Uncharacterized protein n=1 Tax=Pterulicium gracile TaxID=1884261 RepID=A0A5C3QAU0_9AGAR|nr:hypothetical protein BDV98DRAFT_572335 [Pterula gracilis]
MSAPVSIESASIGSLCQLGIGFMSAMGPIMFVRARYMHAGVDHSRIKDLGCYRARVV